MSSTNLICLMDFENVIRAQSEVSTKRVMQRLSGLLRERGRLIAAKAYADWRQYGKEANIVEDTGFELVYASQRQNGKNSADIRLVLDAIDLIHAGRSLQELVIVSGDSDMIPLVQRARSHGVRVTIITDRRSASGRLSAHADEIVFIEALQGSAPERDDIAQAERILVRALRQEDPMQGLLASRLKEGIIRLHPAFNERNLGFSKFAAFLEEMQKKGHLRLESTPSGLVVHPVAHAAPTRPTQPHGENAPGDVERRLLAMIRRRNGQFVTSDIHIRAWQTAVSLLHDQGQMPRNDLIQQALTALEGTGFQDLTKSKVSGILTTWSLAGGLQYEDGEYHPSDVTEVDAIHLHNRFVVQLGQEDGIGEDAVLASSLCLFADEADYTDDTW